MTVRRIESTPPPATPVTVDETQQSKIGQAMEGISQASEQIQTSATATLEVQPNDRELTGEALRAMGIEGAMGGLNITDDGDAGNDIDDGGDPSVPFEMPYHGFSPYFDVSDEEPFDYNIIRADRVEGTPHSKTYYDRWNDRNDADEWFARNVYGWDQRGNTIRIIIIQRPPEMFHALVDLATSHGASVGEVHRDERDRMSVELFMHGKGREEFRALAEKHAEKIYQKQARNEKKDNYAKQLEYKKRAINATKEKKAEINQSNPTQERRKVKHKHSRHLEHSKATEKPQEDSATQNKKKPKHKKLAKHKK